MRQSDLGYVPLILEFSVRGTIFSLGGGREKFLDNCYRPGESCRHAFAKNWYDVSEASDVSAIHSLLTMDGLFAL